MTRYLSLAVFPAALIAGLSLGVMAEARGMGIGFDFDAVDTNSDGKVTPEEMRTFHQGHVAAMDANSDGFIDNAEMQAFMAARMSERLEDMAKRRIEVQDADGDGKLSLAEAGQMPRKDKMMYWLDKDGDGAVSKAELERAQAKMEKRYKRYHEGGMFGYWGDNDAE